MTKLWMMTFDLAVGDTLLELQSSADPPTFALENFEALADWSTQVLADSLAAPLGSEYVPAPPPEPLKLRLAEPGIAPNLIDMGFRLVSAKARAAMQADEFLSWFPIDTSASSPEAQAQDYKLMHVKRSAVAVDAERSSGRIVDRPAEFGLPARQVWDPVQSGPGHPPSAFHWREDIEPPAPIFCERLTQMLLVTDDLARRIIEAGIEDIAFVDQENDGSRAELRMRG